MDKAHHPHDHTLLRIPDNGGKQINIRKKDLLELHEKFSGKLKRWSTTLNVPINIGTVRKKILNVILIVYRIFLKWLILVG
ncbi:hypothetical protein [Candidatus Williamhamiltonella defendens]|uniref:hypothetical protein n=1 Tax=Candidatus Williamhamiltonella defendens TaxID=138072 RepID=UPI00130D6A31|nr:hypothetical protein [Candidatus Hamiltonella defensa]